MIDTINAAANLVSASLGDYLEEFARSVKDTVKTAGATEVAIAERALSEARKWGEDITLATTRMLTGATPAKRETGAAAFDLYKSAARFEANRAATATVSVAMQAAETTLDDILGFVGKLAGIAFAL